LVWFQFGLSSLAQNPLSTHQLLSVDSFYLNLKLHFSSTMQQEDSAAAAEWSRKRRREETGQAYEPANGVEAPLSVSYASRISAQPELLQTPKRFAPPRDVASAAAAPAPAASMPTEAAPPRRPQSAFLFYLAAHRAKIKAAFPEVAPAQKHLTAKAASDQDHFEEHSAQPQFNMLHSPIPTEQQHRVPPSLSQASDMPSASVGGGSLARLLGFEWHRLSPEQKLPYEVMATQDKIRYRREKQRAEQQQEEGDAAAAVPQQTLDDSSSSSAVT
jgi:hypothetical protein